MKDFEKRAFYNNVAIKMGITDLKQAEDAYKAVMKAIVQDMKDREICKAPDLGVFKIVRHKARKSNNARTGETMQLPEMSTFKFSADYKLRKYFRNL